MCPTSVQRITLPLALNSEPWKILTLVMDSMDLPSMGLMTLKTQAGVVLSMKIKIKKLFADRVLAHLLISLNYRGILILID